MMIFIVSYFINLFSIISELANLEDSLQDSRKPDEPIPLPLPQHTIRSVNIFSSYSSLLLKSMRDAKASEMAESEPKDVEVCFHSMFDYNYTISSL